MSQDFRNDDYMKPEFHAQIQSEVEKLERQVSSPYAYSYIVLPSNKEYRKIGNRNAKRLFGLYHFNDHTCPETKTKGIQEASDKAKSAIFIKDGLYSLTTNVTHATKSLHILGESIADSVIKATGNFDAFTVTSRYALIETLQFWTSAAQTSGAALNMTGYNQRARHINIGSVIQAQQFFYDGVIFSSQYGVLEDMLINNCVHSGVSITGGSNQMINHVFVSAWGADQFPSTSPAGFILTQTIGNTHLDNIQTAWMIPGILVNPGNGQQVRIIHGTNWDLDSNFGGGLRVAPTGTGVVRDWNISGLWCTANNQRSGNTEPGVDIRGGFNMQIANGNIAYHQHEGFVARLGASQIDLINLQIHDNNQANGNGVVDAAAFAGSPTPNIYINESTFVGNILGGCGDNPGLAGSTGHGGGIYINAATKLLVSKLRLLKNMGGNQFGANMSAGQVYLDDCPGYTPSPYTITAGASPWTGTNNGATKELWNLSNLNGGSVSAITYRGNSGMPTGVNAFPFFLNPGDTIIVTWATTAPTFTRYPVLFV